MLDELGTFIGPWPRYLVITANEKSFNNLSPFDIHKGVNSIAGGDVTIKHQFNGDIYLTCIKKIPIVLSGCVCCLAMLTLLL